MALITSSPLIGHISGSVGSTNFAQTRAGQVARRRKSHLTRATAPQLEQRALLASLGNEWHALTDAYRNAWRAAARDYPYTNRLGIKRTISGFQLYCKLRTTPGSAILEQFNTPPVMRIASTPYTVSVTVAAGPAFNLIFTPDMNILTYTGMLYAARPVSSHFHAHLNYWRFLCLVPNADSPYEFYSDFVQALGAPAAGEVCYVKLRLWCFNRLPSPPVPAHFTVT